MTGADRRPWLIISRREAWALLTRAPEADLSRAMRVLASQLNWIEGGAEKYAPTVANALIREAQP